MITYLYDTIPNKIDYDQIFVDQLVDIHFIQSPFFSSFGFHLHLQIPYS